jgi:hypothetical protein
MTESSVPPDPLRQAALTLHALPDGDRRWILEALGPGRRHRLEPLLLELQTLGIPRDPGLVPREPSAPAGTTSRRPWPQALEAEEITALENALAVEPVAVTRMLLSIEDWSWAPRLLQGLDPARREAVQEGGPAAAPGARLRTAILQALQARAVAQPAPRQTRAEGTWQRLCARITAFGSGA